MREEVDGGSLAASLMDFSLSLETMSLLSFTETGDVGDSVSLVLLLFTAAIDCGEEVDGGSLVGSVIKFVTLSVKDMSLQSFCKTGDVLDARGSVSLVLLPFLAAIGC